MAIDTLNKRFNCLSVARTYTVAAPNPDGAISAQADRQQIAFSYRADSSSASIPQWSITFSGTESRAADLTCTVRTCN